jgi:hypothetical protein
MSNMFKSCKKLNEIFYNENFIIKEGTNITGTFQGCKFLKKLDKKTKAIYAKKNFM